MRTDLPPSGPWRGFYVYGGGARRHHMDLKLEFGGGNITGEGRDDIGPFVISGRYDSRSGECHWTKTYVAAHDVFYIGARNGKSISGNWEIRQDERGGFRIWPLGNGSSDDEVETEAKEQPVEAVGTVVVL